MSPDMVLSCHFAVSAMQQCIISTCKLCRCAVVVLSQVSICCRDLVQETNIAWASDKNSLYGHYKPTNFNNIPQYRGGATISGLYVNEDEHFLVWMRPGAARTVRKLYARINEDIPAGTGFGFPHTCYTCVC